MFAFVALQYLDLFLEVGLCFYAILKYISFLNIIVFSCDACWGARRFPEKNTTKQKTSSAEMQSMRCPCSHRSPEGIGGHFTHAANFNPSTIPQTPRPRPNVS